MIELAEDRCILCLESGCDRLMEIAGVCLFDIHLKCWQNAAEEEEIRDFDSSESWSNFAGNEWDLAEFSWEDSNSDKYWYCGGEQHREDGPAVERADGGKIWYLNNEEYTENEWKEKVKCLS